MMKSSFLVKKIKNKGFSVFGEDNRRESLDFKTEIFLLERKVEISVNCNKKDNQILVFLDIGGAGLSGIPTEAFVKMDRLNTLTTIIGKSNQPNYVYKKNTVKTVLLIFLWTKFKPLFLEEPEVWDVKKLNNREITQRKGDGRM